MHENDISHAVIGAAIEVHREIGPGIIEKPYEEAMCHELHLRGLPFVRQKAVPFIYKGVQLSADLRTDFLVINFHVAVLKDGIYRVVNNLISPDSPPEPPDLHS
jgi:GxxExxY protein